MLSIYHIAFYLNCLEPSELNRLYTLISNNDGSVNQKYFRELQAHIESLPSRPPKRMHDITLEQPVPDKKVLPRSRLIDQFYTHSLPGIESESLNGVRSFIKNQRNLCDSANNGTELLKLAIRKLVNSFHDIPSNGLGVPIPTHNAYQDDDQNKDAPSVILKCPARFMEKSIAIVLEHTEHLTIDIQKNSFEERQ